jgi:predicted CoA-binding protein
MSTPDIKKILSENKVIAVVGLSPNPGRDSYRVARYMQEQGYRIIPVNPMVTEVLGEKAYPDLKTIPETVDVVDVFRRPEEVVPIAQDAVAIKAKVLWLQDTVVNEEAAAIARKGGLTLVMDDCIMRQHRAVMG